MVHVDWTTCGWQTNACYASSCRVVVATQRTHDGAKETATRRPSTTTRRRRVDRGNVRRCTNQGMQDDDETQIRGNSQSIDAVEQGPCRCSRRPATRGRKSNQTRSNPLHHEETTAVAGRISFDAFQQIVAMPSTSVPQPLPVPVSSDGWCMSHRSSRPTFVFANRKAADTGSTSSITTSHSCRVFFHVPHLAATPRIALFPTHVGAAFIGSACVARSCVGGGSRPILWRRGPSGSNHKRIHPKPTTNPILYSIQTNGTIEWRRKEMCKRRDDKENVHVGRRKTMGWKRNDGDDTRHHRFVDTCTCSHNRKDDGLATSIPSSSRREERNE